MTSPNDLLRVKNPFFTGSVTDPWERCADIESINYETFQGIMHLIRKVYQEPKATHAALVFGESGLGKTHLLGRIRRSSNHDETPYVFVYIWPMVDPDTPMRHLLQSIVTDLAKDSCDISNFSTFDWLITRMLEEYITSEYGESDETLIKIRDDPSQFFTNDPSNKIDPETIRGTIDFIGVHWGIPRYLLKILFQLVIPYKKISLLAG